MKKELTSSFDDFLQELHRDPDFRREYRRQRPRYDLLREIIRRRKELGITQKQLEGLTGIHQSNISRIESGERDVRLSTIITIAEGLDSSVIIQFTPTIPHEEFDAMVVGRSRSVIKMGDSFIHQIDTPTQSTRISTDAHLEAERI